jgi:ribosomal protein S19E (S16A)
MPKKGTVTAVTNIKHDDEWYDAGADVSHLPKDVLQELHESGAVEGVEDEPNTEFEDSRKEDDSGLPVRVKDVGVQDMPVKAEQLPGDTEVDAVAEDLKEGTEIVDPGKEAKTSKTETQTTKK